MTALIRLLIRICLFRNGPEDMPYIPPLLGLLLVAWFVVQVLSGVLQQSMPLPQMIGVQFLSMAVLQVGTAAVLVFKNLTARWTQTAMALIGVDLVMSTAALPLLLIDYLAGASLGFVNVLSLLLISWQLAVQSFIFHRALRVSPFLGLWLAFGFLVLTYLVVGWVMPQALQAV